MDLEFLECHLGIEYAYCMDPELLPSEGWRFVNRVTSEGKTLLIEAVQVCNIQCVDFLLKCGVDVNARDKGGRRAIDYALDGEQEDRMVGEILLLLLQRDSLLPDVKDSENRLKLEKLIHQNDRIAQFFQEREEFHDILRKKDIKSLGDILSKDEHPSSGPRYWVNRSGHTALYTAGYGLLYDVWAFLKSKKFEYGVDEMRVMSLVEDGHQIEFSQAMEKYFTRIPVSHVIKMVSRSKVLGCPGGMRKELQRIYEKVDEFLMTSLLLQCLQDEQFEVIFDMDRRGVRCMYASSSNDHLDPSLDRLYISGRVAEEFEFSDVITNLVHNLAHKAMHVVFSNGGLPYENGDLENRKKYEQIVSTLTSADRIKKCDDVIQRLKEYPKEIYAQEIIVIVPEMVIKYHEKKDKRVGFRYLRTQAYDLFNYYSKYVTPEMEGYTKKTKMVKMVPIFDLLIYLRSNHKHDYIEVAEETEELKIGCYRSVRVLRVSNLKLGISHLEKAYEGLISVDWRMYEKHEAFLNKAHANGHIRHIAVVWDEDMAAEFYSILGRYNVGSRLKQIKKLSVRFVTLVIPKNCSFPMGIEPVDYTWKDLSAKAKSWLLEKTMNFQGRDVTLKQLLEDFLGIENANSKMDSLLDSDELSMLIDQEKTTIGRPLDCAPLEGMRVELVKHFIPRSTRVSLKLSRFSIFTVVERSSDAFLFFNASKSDLHEAGIMDVSVWNGNEVPDETSCFLLSGELTQMNDDALYKEIVRQLKEFPCPNADGKWRFAHFINFEGMRKMTHLRTEEVHAYTASIVAGPFGSGKSVFVKMRALERKERFPGHWVEVVELANHGNELGQWEEGDFKSREVVEELLFDVIRGKAIDRTQSKDLSLEKIIFKHFCRATEKLFVVFDDFDKGDTLYRKKVIPFLKVVQENTNVDFIVTTRIEVCEQLENQLSTLAQTLVPFHPEEQVILLDSQWNACLQSLSEGERTVKVESMISGLQSNYNEEAQKVSDLIECLQLLLVEDSSSTIPYVHFEVLARELMAFGKSVVETEGNLLETPLYAWMLAIVSFENNFNFKKYLCLSELYKLFVEVKINKYNQEKAKTIESVASTSTASEFNRSVYDLLKKFSAYLFLGDRDYELTEGEKHDVLGTGLVVQRGDKTVFEHRSFLEYFFALWLLGKANEEKVTKIWLPRNILHEKYNRVYRFIDRILVSEYGKRSLGIKEDGMELEMPLLNHRAFIFGNQFVSAMQNKLFFCAFYCYEGILQYLVESSGRFVHDVIFGKSGWNVKSLNITFNPPFKTFHWSAFDCCSMFVRGFIPMDKTEVANPEIDCLKFLQKLLRLTEEYGLIGNLKQYILKNGFNWTGVSEDKLWKMEEGREQLRLIFKFLVKNKDVLGESMKILLCSKELLENSARYAFDLLVYVLDSILECQEFKYLLLKQENFFRAWTTVIEWCELKTVENVWSFVEGKLSTKNDVQLFLLRKLDDRYIVLKVAFFNLSDPNVVPYVWGLHRRVFDEQECKVFLFYALNGLSSINFTFNLYGALKLFFDCLVDGFLVGEEVSRLLLSRDESDECALLTFSYSSFAAPTLYKLQELLLTGQLETADVLRNMKGHYRLLSSWCFSDYYPWLALDVHIRGGEVDLHTHHSKWIIFDADFVAGVQREWNEFLPSRESYPLVDGVPSDGDGRLLNVLNCQMRGVLAVQLKAFLVLLDRQFGLEERVLGRTELLERLTGEWFKIYSDFHPMIEKGCTNGTSAFVIVYFFAILSKFLSKEQVTTLLLESGSDEGTVFHGTVREMWGQRDPRGFLAFYDIARWSTGESALWRVHSIGRWGDDKGTVLELLLEAQGKGYFEFSTSDAVHDNQEDLSGSDETPSDWEE